MLDIRVTDNAATFTYRDKTVTLQGGAYERLVAAAECGVLESLQDFWDAVNRLPEDEEVLVKGAANGK